MLMSMCDVIWMVWYAPQVVLPSFPASEQSRPADSVMNKCHARHARFKGNKWLGKLARLLFKHIGGLKYILGICEHRIKKRQRIRNW